MRRAAAVLLPALSFVAWLGAAAPVERALAFLQPSIRMTSDERRDLSRDRVVSRVLSAPNNEVAVIGVTAVNVPGSELLHASRDIRRLRRSPQVLAMGRLSTPPQLSDFDGLQLDKEDLESIRVCVPGDCGVKLADGEMQELEAAAQGADWQDRLQRAFRAVLLERVREYLRGGLAAVPDTHGHADPVSQQASFAAVLRRSSFLAREAPALDAYLEQGPADPPSGIEWYLYWSKEKYAGKAVVRVAHVAMMSVDGGAAGPQAVVVEKQVFATHYIDAFLGVTTIASAGDGMPNYLTYVNRSKVDFLGGFFGPIKRAIARREIESYLKKILALARRRLEATN
ncbi:MAG: hypothetical protein ACM3SQ_20500 [Betaproteobacteria bacterium]